MKEKQDVVASGRPRRRMIVQTDQHALAAGVIGHLLEAVYHRLPQGITVGCFIGNSSTKVPDHRCAHERGLVNAHFDLSDALLELVFRQGRAHDTSIRTFFNTDEAATNANETDGQATLLAKELDPMQVGRFCGAESAVGLQVYDVEPQIVDHADHLLDILPVSRVILVIWIRHRPCHRQHGIASEFDHICPVINRPVF